MKPERRLLVCGSREWDDRWTMFNVLDAYLTNCTVEGVHLMIIEGGAPGADQMAKAWAQDRRVPYWEFPARWEVFGKGAGPIRNREMLDKGDPHEVFAFHEDIGSSRGTRNMVKQAGKAGVPVKVFSSEGEVLVDPSWPRYRRRLDGSL